MKRLAEFIAQAVEPVGPPDLTFDRFWSTFPRKAGKKVEARDVYEKLSAADRAAAISGSSYHLENNPQWRDKTKIPYPTTYLRGRRWEDQLVHTPSDEIQRAQADSPVNMVWSAFSQAFGKRFLEEFGYKPNPVWTRGLADYTAAKVLRGIRTVVDSNMQHPPSLPQFKSYCRTMDLPESRMLPKAPTTNAVALAAFDEMRERGLIK